jgi:hypothetical protein
MTITIPTQGTHMSDGVRTGPILGSQYVAGPTIVTPSQMISTPVDSQPPGIYNTPMSLLDIIPYPVNATAIAGSQTPAAAGDLTLVSVSGPGITVMTYQSITGVLKLDCPRNIELTGGSGTVSATFLVFGWDQYGMPLVEQITGPAGATVVQGNKAFLYIRAVHTSAATTGIIQVGVGNKIGLPYYLADANYIGIPSVNGQPDLSVATTVTRILASNPITTDGSTATVVVAVANTSGFVIGEYISISGATATGGISAANLNIDAPITAFIANTSVSYVAGQVSTSVATGGGVSVGLTVNLPVGFPVLGGLVAIGDPRTATATTGDVRGTYAPGTAANGINRLTINMYSASGDSRNYYAASNGSIILLTNPLGIVDLSQVVTVLAPGHQFTNGENVTISGATITSMLNPNTTAPVTVIDENHFSYVAPLPAATATNTAVGGSAVLMTPAKGNLYQVPTGRFGVQQYGINVTVV